MTNATFNGLKPWSVLVAIFAVLLASTSTPVHAQTKMVFAHYMVTNQDYGANINGDKVQGYMREIQQAQAAGIDGFILNAGGWINQTYYITYTEQIFQAALNLNTGFKLFMSCDFCCGNGVNDAEDMMRRLCNDPNYSKVYFKYNNKWVLTTFDGQGQIGTGGFSQIRNDLANGTNPNPAPAGFGQSSTAPLQTVIVPAFFWGGEVPSLASIQSGFGGWSSVIDGNVYWGIAGVPGSGGSQDLIPSSEYYAQTDHGGGKIYMAPVCLQFWGANANRYFEYSGYSGLRKMFMDAINTSHPEWIEIITWNDFVEGSYVSPIDDPNAYPNSNYLQFSNTGFYHSHNGATALLPYLISYYKNGVAPTLTQDSIYWAYRTQSSSSNPGNPAVDNKYGPVSDVVYVTANLTSAATIKVTCGSNVQTINAAAGSNDYSVPFSTGTTPNFQVIRGGTTEINVNGTDQIQSAPGLNDYYYSTGSASSAPQGGGGTAPATPTGLTATAGNSQVALSWGAVSGATSYNIYRSTTSGGEGTTAVATSSTNSYTNTGLTNGTTYYFKVAAVNANGSSGQSTEASAKPQAATEAPYGGTAWAIPGTVQAENFDTGGEGLAYHDAEAANQGGQYRTADGVDVETCSDTGGGYDVGWNNTGEWMRYTVNVSTAGNYTVTFRVSNGTTANGTFHLQNASGTNLSGTVTVTPTGGWQTWANVTATVNLPAGQQILTLSDDGSNYNINSMAFASQGTAPATPTGLAASAGNSQVGLSWGSVTGATSYNIYRSTTAGGEGTTVVATSSTNSYTNTGLTNGTTYYFKVAAVNANGSSGQSSEASATPASAGEAPYGGTAWAIPGTVQSENYDTGGEGVAYHDAEAANQGGQYRTADGVDIEACTDTGGGYNVGWTNAGEWMKYTVNVSTAGTYTVTFRVANGTTGNGSLHIQNASGTNLSGAVTVAPTGGWQTWASVTANVTLPAGQQILTFYEDTTNFNVNSMAFAASGGGGGAPSAPTGLAASAGTGQISLTWNAVSGATSYNIYRGTNSGGEGATAIGSASGTSYTNTGTADGTQYFYTVKAVNASGTSGASNEASAISGAIVSGVDLIVTAVTWSPSSITSGAHVVFSYTIKNQGQTATAGGVVLGGQFQVDGNTSVINWEDNYTSSLGPGQSVTLTATGGTNGVNYWTATSGAHTVTGWIDDVNRIAESNENNNKLTVNFSVP